MDAFERYFDHYVISARIKPALFVVMPLAMTVFVWWPETRQLGGALLVFLATFGVISFLSILISNYGNELQTRLFKEWGGAPSITLLRFRSSELDPYTKKRYHRQLEAMIPGLMLPSHEQEQENPSEADACYASSSNYLRERCRDKAKFPLVYADNVAYGYARNQFLMKPWGIVSAVLSIVVNIALLYSEISFDLGLGQSIALTMQVQAGLVATGVSFIVLGVFVFTVNRQCVERRAVRYAKNLLAVCDADAEVSRLSKKPDGRDQAAPY